MANESTHDASAGEPERQDRLLRVGPFRLLERLGEGGMGIVYLAERREPVAQRVALKVIRSDRLGKAYRARFAMEQQALARMEHPSIARLIDAGDDDGQSWFAMEYVPGQPLTDYCRGHRMPLEQRLVLFQQICDGVQHAHTKGILHRDLKPANILVHELDGRPVAKIIDFGLAQPVDPLQIRATLHEGLRQVVGTLAYMSPEQADRSEGDLDTRTDVYSLGVVLYELLTGQLPLDLDAIEAGGPAGLVSLLRDRVPPKPSTRVASRDERVSAAAAERQVSPQRLCAFVRGELDWITMKALAVDRQRRYVTVRELGRDIERFRQHRPVEAGPPGAVYVLRKWLRRHARALGAAAALAVAGVSVAVGFALLHARARRAEQRREILDRAAVLAEQVQRVDELWPADAAHVAALERWLAEAERLRAVGQSLDALADELAAEAGVDRDAIASAARHALVATVAARRTSAAELRRLVPVVAARLAAARTLASRTIDAFAAAWRDASAAVAADTRFAGFELAPIAGLVPLGTNPHGGLQEFYLPASAGDAPLPARRPDGGFDIGPMTGLLFVLLPGGHVAVPTSDRQVTWSTHVRPFLLSRYEMTQAQWARLAGEGLRDPPALERCNPSNTPAGLQRVAGGPGSAAVAGTPITWDAVQWIHPVQQVSWELADRLLPRWSLRLPSAAEWVCAAGGRADPADTDFGWLTADPVAAANLRWVEPGEPAGGADDGFVYTAPVGLLAANPFGLHDVFGNVAELCADGYADGYADGRPGDLVPDARMSRRAVYFGCGYPNRYHADLLPFRQQLPIQNIAAHVGLRPAFALAP